MRNSWLSTYYFKIAYPDLRHQMQVTPEFVGPAPRGEYAVGR